MNSFFYLIKMSNIMQVVLSVTYMKKMTYQVTILQLKQKWNMKFAVDTLLKDDWQTPWSRILLETAKAAQQFIIPEGSLLCSQQSTTSPYPEPHHPSSLSKSYPNITYLPIYIKAFLLASFLEVLLPKPCIHSTFAPDMLHALPISSSFSSSF
jgi:hypothetical protein